MPEILFFLASLNWTYINDRNVTGWFADQNGKHLYSFYHDKRADALAIVFWSGHPRERVPLAWVLDRDGFRIQELEYFPDVAPSLRETMQ